MSLITRAVNACCWSYSVELWFYFFNMSFLWNLKMLIKEDRSLILKQRCLSPWLNRGHSVTGTNDVSCRGASCTACDISLAVCISIIHLQREIRETTLPSAFLGCSSIRSRAERVICYFLLLHHPLSSSNMHTHMHTHAPYLQSLQLP